MSGASNPRRGRVRFGLFELNLRTGELRKSGVRVRLAGQPLTVLERLVERPGDLVSREELRRELWPDSTFGDFERNLNSAMKRLRAALGDSADTPRFIETLPRRGYRFLAPVERIADPETRLESPALPDPIGGPLLLESPAPAGSADASAGGARLALSRPIRVLAGLVAFAGLAIIAVLASRSEPSRGVRVLAVLPFVLAGGGSAEDDYLAFGLSEALIKELSRLDGPRIISQTSSMQYKDTGRTLPEIARDLGVDAVIEGSVQREGERVRITVQLIEAATDTHLWADSYEREMGSVLTLADEVARAVAREIHGQVSPAAAARLPVRATDPGVAQAYLRGRYYIGKATEGDRTRGREEFERALAIDAAHAPSHAGLADYYILTDAMAPEAAYPLARRHAQRAIELDESLPDAHASLAFVRFYFDWDWEAAERAFRRAIALDPGHARARRWYALFLSAMRRHPEALEQIERALAVDPIAIANHDAAAMIHFNAQEFDASAARGRTIAELDAFDPRGFEHQVLSLLKLDQPARALALVDEGLRLSSTNTVFHLARVVCLARLGRTAEAEAAFAYLEEGAGGPYVPSLFLAIALTEMGQHARALDRLERALDERDPYLVLLDVSPWFDPLREDPRFARLRARLAFR